MNTRRSANVVLRGAAVAALIINVGARAESPFATAVLDYSPAPGQFVNNPAFNDPLRALGAPVGAGTVSPDNTSAVSLGGFGGSIMLAFDHLVLDDPRNPLGLDFIVFGNAFWPDGTPTRRWGEAAIIEISLDVNGNGIADDPWFVIPGSHLNAPPGPMQSQEWDNNNGTPTPPANIAWYPAGAPSPMTTSAYRLPAVFETFTLVNQSGSAETYFGYGDLSPTLLLGDMSGASGGVGDNRLDDPEDDPSLAPELFYTVPDDPMTVGIDPGSGGGDAFDIAWVVDPISGAPANLPGFHFIRITNGVNAVIGPLGEVSAEIDAVADVRAMSNSADLNGDGFVNGADLAALLSAWGAPGGAADLNHDGDVNGADLAILLANWSPS